MAVRKPNKEEIIPIIRRAIDALLLAEVMGEGDSSG